MWHCTVCFTKSGKLASVGVMRSVLFQFVKCWKRHWCVCSCIDFALVQLWVEHYKSSIKLKCLSLQLKHPDRQTRTHSCSHCFSKYYTILLSKILTLRLTGILFRQTNSMCSIKQTKLCSSIGIGNVQARQIAIERQLSQSVAQTINVVINWQTRRAGFKLYCPVDQTDSSWANIVKLFGIKHKNALQQS